ncbi:MAG TPA: hypothetical protein VLA67_06720 [Nitrospiraceae bacterium]|nr:hypothetical protein [Nitrospiraceae bacterium]
MTDRKMLGLVALFFMLFAALALALAEDRPSTQRRSLDPMNHPMDELGVTGKDDTLCSDRWYSCTTYDRQQFDQKYPGQPLKDLLRFGEPDWPDRPRDGREGRDGKKLPGLFSWNYAT